jgi:hypothetical protein
MLASSRLLAAAFLLAACGPEAGKAETPARANNGGSGPAVARGGASGEGGSAASASGGAPSGSGGAPSSAGGVPLPASVTANFPNQGWFGDDQVAKAFTPGTTVIRQGDATTGPCGARQAPMRGRCLKVVYTPPANLSKPDGGSGYVGVFFLTTLLKEHAGTKIGDPNWGDFPDEPGVALAPGASKVSFHAAAEAEGTAVAFKAGVMKDSFVVAEQAETLGTTWKSYALPITGSYGAAVLGGFAWVLTDTSKPVTFYLDNIVWE